MNIQTIVAAFGTDQRLTYNELAQRLGLPLELGAAKRFANKLRKFNLRPAVSRYNDEQARRYDLAHFKQVEETKQPYQALDITL